LIFENCAAKWIILADVGIIPFGVIPIGITAFGKGKISKK
jgi:hypothetical protein